MITCAIFFLINVTRRANQHWLTGQFWPTVRQLLPLMYMCIYCVIYNLVCILCYI